MFEAIVAHATMLRALGAQPVVLAVEDDSHAEDRWRLDGAEITVVPRGGPRQLAYGKDLGHALDSARLDLVHLHGIWQYPVHAAGAWARRQRRPLVISPHGMLAPWITHSGVWKKRAARIGWEWRGWRSAAAFHALTEAEADDIAREAGRMQVAVIPNAAPTASPPPQPRPANALYLGRIHPKKNLPALIEAWVQARPGLPADATLTIAGWGDDAGVAALERQIAGHHASIQFVGAAFGSQKAALLDVSRFCLLPSFSEGLPMAVLEAWAAGVPTIMSAACHLPQGFDDGAAIESGTDVDSIRRALLAAFKLDEAEWLTMARAARDLATGPFGQARVARQWERLYAALLHAEG